MNRIYRLIWSRVSNTWVAVSENTKGRGKPASAKKCVVGAAFVGAASAANGVRQQAGSYRVSWPNELSGLNRHFPDEPCLESRTILRIHRAHF